jgi:hypothetical protein
MHLILGQNLLMFLQGSADRLPPHASTTTTWRRNHLSCSCCCNEAPLVPVPWWFSPCIWTSTPMYWYSHVYSWTQWPRFMPLKLPISCLLLVSPFIFATLFPLYNQLTSLHDSLLPQWWREYAPPKSL